MSRQIQITDDEFVEKYKPVKSPFSSDASHFGAFIDTGVAELEYLKTIDPNKVWTVVSTDIGTSITNGFHFVNRMGYIVTEIALEEDVLFCEVSDPYDVFEVFIRFNQDEYDADQDTYSELETAVENLGYESIDADHEICSSNVQVEEDTEGLEADITVYVTKPRFDDPACDSAAVRRRFEIFAADFVRDSLDGDANFTVTAKLEGAANQPKI